MKVLINTRFGGFCLSSEFVSHLIQCFPEYTKKEEFELFPESEFPTKLTENLFAHEYLNGFILDTNEQCIYLFDDYDNDIRSDPRFLKIVEDFGLDKAASKYTALKIVEIPDDVEWYIYRDDSGPETIHEGHRTWS